MTPLDIAAVESAYTAAEYSGEWMVGGPASEPDVETTQIAKAGPDKGVRYGLNVWATVLDHASDRECAFALAEARLIVLAVNALPHALAEIARLRALVEEREADMHMRIRLGYDKTVADTWRAENERLRARVIEAFQAGMCVGYARPQGGSQTYHREAAERWSKEAEDAAAKGTP